MNPAGQDGLRNLLKQLLEKTMTVDELKTKMEEMVLEPETQALLERLTTAFQADEDPAWIEMVAAAREGLTTPELAAFTQDRAALQTLEPSLVALFDALIPPPDDDLLTGLPTFPTFAQQQAAALVSDPNWVETALAHGRAWQNQVTGQWRQVQISLAGLLTPPSASPALQGLMRDPADPASAPLGHLSLAPDEANFDLELTLVPDAAPSDESRCTVQAVITLHDRLGDFSGVTLNLLWGESVQTEVTDVQGQVTFTDLPREALKTMELLVKLPENSR